MTIKWSYIEVNCLVPIWEFPPGALNVFSCHGDYHRSFQQTPSWWLPYIWYLYTYPLIVIHQPLGSCDDRSFNSNTKQVTVFGFKYNYVALHYWKFQVLIYLLEMHVYDVSDLVLLGWPTWGWMCFRLHYLVQMHKDPEDVSVKIM